MNGPFCWKSNFQLEEWKVPIIHDSLSFPTYKHTYLYNRVKRLGKGIFSFPNFSADFVLSVCMLLLFLCYICFHRSYCCSCCCSYYFFDVMFAIVFVVFVLILYLLSTLLLLFLLLLLDSAVVLLSLLPLLLLLWCLNWCLLQLWRAAKLPLYLSGSFCHFSQ